MSISVSFSCAESLSPSLTLARVLHAIIRRASSFGNGCTLGHRTPRPAHTFEARSSFRPVFDYLAGTVHFQGDVIAPIGPGAAGQGVAASLAAC
ncbi:MAG: hypothetical protein ACT4QB_07940 [Gammaproteobacteria bacterium]